MTILTHARHDFTAGDCTWSQADDKYRTGYAGGDDRLYTLPDAKIACIYAGSGVCAGVTCTTSGDCTLRANDVLLDSSSGEISYSPHTICFENPPATKPPAPETTKPALPQPTGSKAILTPLHKLSRITLLLQAAFASAAAAAVGDP